MPKKKKPIRNSKKKPMRPTKRSRGKTSARKKKPARSQGETVSMIAVEVSRVESIGVVEESSDVDEGITVREDDLDEHFPPDYGGSE